MSGLAEERCLPTSGAVVIAAMYLPGGELEYAVLEALWEKKRASAPELHAAIGAPRNLAYTTTAKVLERLHSKDLIERVKLGRSFVYRPRITRRTVMRARAREAVALLFRSEPLPAVATLVDAVEAHDPKLLDELERLVLERKEARGNGSRGS